jgi:hypothetical protein
MPSEAPTTRYPPRRFRLSEVEAWLAAGRGTFERLQDAKRTEADAISRPGAWGAMTVEQWAREWQDVYARGAVSTSARTAMRASRSSTR